MLLNVLSQLSTLVSFSVPPSSLHSMVTSSSDDRYKCSYKRPQAHCLLCHLEANVLGFVLTPNHVVSGDGEVYVWDMRTKKCKHKFRDEGCLKGACIDVSKNGRFVACG